MKTALTIAGSDSSGGAGIQADIKTMTVNGVYAMSVITALTAQNTMGVADIFDVSPKFIKSQIDAVFQDIVPASTKIGMVSSEEAVDVISERLKFYNAENVVVDPVMVATSGAKLITDNAVCYCRIILGVCSAYDNRCTCVIVCIVVLNYTSVTSKVNIESIKVIAIVFTCCSVNLVILHNTTD